MLAEVGTVGTPTNSATQRYLNGKKVPQLLISAGGSKFNDPKQYPWTVPFYPSFETEAMGFARYALKAQQAPKIGVLYQNDDYGKDYLKGLKKALGENYSKLVVSEQSYELTDPTVDSQVINLAGSGANVFMNFTTPKFSAQALRKADEQRHKREEQLIAAANGRRQVSCFPEWQSERSSHSSHAGGGLSARTHTHSPGPPSSSCARMHAFSRPSIKSVCARLRSPAC